MPFVDQRVFLFGVSKKLYRGGLCPCSAVVMFGPSDTCPDTCPDTYLDTHPGTYVHNVPFVKSPVVRNIH